MITLTETDVKSIMSYLGDVPSKFANPLITFLTNKLEKKEEVLQEQFQTLEEKD